MSDEKGFVGTKGSGADARGAIRLVVYGNPETNEAVGWSVGKWEETGKKGIGMGYPEYGWVPMPTAQSAASQPGFNEAFGAFFDKKHGINRKK